MGVSYGRVVSTIQLNTTIEPVLTTEPVLEPLALLRKECKKAGFGPDEFLVSALGETRSPSYM